MKKDSTEETLEWIKSLDDPELESVPKALKLLDKRAIYCAELVNGLNYIGYKSDGKFGFFPNTFSKNDDKKFLHLAKKYDLENALPNGVAVQIVLNSDDKMNLVLAFVTTTHRFFSLMDLIELATFIKIPTIKIISTSYKFDKKKFDKLLENCTHGIIIRSIDIFGKQPIRFKVKK